MYKSDGSVGRLRHQCISKTHNVLKAIIQFIRRRFTSHTPVVGRVDCAGSWWASYMVLCDTDSRPQLLHSCIAFLYDATIPRECYNRCVSIQNQSSVIPKCHSFLLLGVFRFARCSGIRRLCISRFTLIAPYHIQQAVHRLFFCFRRACIVR